MNKLCEIMKDKITDYVLGILNDDEIANLEKHIEQCSECKEYLESLKKEREILLHLGKTIDRKMKTREENVIAALGKISNKKSTKSTFFSNRVFRFAAAAVIAIALLIPLSYGANNIIKRLIAGSIEYDDYKGDFLQDKDIRVELQVGNKEKKNIVSASNIRFFVEDGEFRGTLRYYLGCSPKFKWITKIELFDSQNKNLASTEHVNENTGVEISSFSSYPDAIHFTLGKSGDISDAEKFIVTMKEASDNSETTSDAWYESDKLNIVRGHVTNKNGQPVANAIVQIREKRKPGQDGIAAPDVITDENGFYSYDAINWEYHVGVLVYDPVSGRDNFKHQYKRLNKYMTKSQIIDFKIDDFPTGDSSIFGTVQSLDGKVIEEFSIDIRLQVDWKDYSDEYLYQFGYKIPFITQDGKFEIKNLPAGKYDVTIYPTKEELLQEKDFVNRKEYSFEIQSGQKLEIGTDNSKGEYLYGRVLFNDGTPAVPDLNSFKTQIVYWHQNSGSGLVLASLDSEGYFAVQIPDEAMEALKSGKASLKVSIAQPDLFYGIESGEMFPIDFLSPERDKAEVIQIDKPNVYYGRIIYGKGKSAVPEVIPWEFAREGVIRAVLIHKSRIATGGGKGLGIIDKDGYFSTYLTSEEIEQLKNDDLVIQISYPSYELQNNLYSIYYPFEMLSTEKEKVEGYNILTDKSMEYENLQEVLLSIDKLKELYVTLETYANDNRENYPDILGLLDIEDENMGWLVQNVEYFPITRSQDISKAAETVIAYNKILLEKYDAALVLFGDGHIKYCWPRELEILGIKKPETNILP